MPASNPSSSRSRWEAWPPTQVHIRDDMDPDCGDSDLPMMDDNPLTYFLTPTRDDEDELIDLDLDAGIEDMKHPPNIVRSVSPSSLTGLSRPPPRPPTPPRSPPSHLSPDPDSTTDDDDDGEDYVRMGTNYRLPLNLPFSLREFTGRKVKKSTAGQATAALQSSSLSTYPGQSYSSPAWTGGNPSTSQRGRPTVRYGPSPHGPRHTRSNQRPHSLSIRQSPRAWREPSPDVWSIEEEGTEDEVVDDDANTKEEETKALPVKAKKKVRFALPAEEV